MRQNSQAFFAIKEAATARLRKYGFLKKLATVDAKKPMFHQRRFGPENVVKCMDIAGSLPGKCGQNSVSLSWTAPPETGSAKTP
jgi:hypothetical protein